MGVTVAVMQPYFFPYAGYFRLFAAVDRFVVLDDVQFPRRGWVHRNRFTGDDGVARWLTLPLERADFEAPITALRLATDAGARLAAESRRFPALRAALDRGDALARGMLDVEADATAYLTRQMAACCRRMGLPVEMIRASSLEVPPGQRAQDHILALAEAAGATTYVNAPGGRDLYDADAFAARGIDLRFLSPWEGSTASILELLTTSDPAEVGALVRAQAVPTA